MGPDAAEEYFHAWIATIPPRSTWEELSELQRTILLVYALELEVFNGGIHQFFGNPAGDKWKETTEALKRMRATRIGQILERALTVFPHGAPSADHLTRAEQFRAIGPEAEALLRRLTDEYYGLYHVCPEQDAYRIMSEFLLREQGPVHR
jgi:hypothetical protein